VEVPPYRYIWLTANKKGAGGSPTTSRPFQADGYSGIDRMCLGLYTTHEAAIRQPVIHQSQVALVAAALAAYFYLHTLLEISRSTFSGTQAFGAAVAAQVELYGC